MMLPLSIILVLVNPVLAALDQSVGLYEMHTINVTNTNSYDNPFKDVILTATFTSPTGGDFNVYGFYDAGTTWRIRFTPNETGTWDYTYQFSDGSPVTGSLLVEPSNKRGFLRLDSSGRVGNRANTPFHT
jgi:hypothetical protein